MRRKGVLRRKNISKRIKTQHKKSLVSKKKAHNPKSTLWDKNLKISDNLKNIGLMTNINKEIDKDLQRKEDENDKNNLPKIDVEEEIDISNLDKGKIVLEPITYATKKIKLTPDEKITVEQMIKKHGENFNKIFMDLKVNKFQWNVDQIKRAYKKYNALYGNDKK